MPKKRPCIGCREPRKLIARGLCSGCYMAARREINAKRETWESIERKKLATPKSRSKFRKALERAK